MNHVWEDKREGENGSWGSRKPKALLNAEHRRGRLHDII